MDVSKRCTGEAAKSCIQADRADSRDPNGAPDGRKSRELEGAAGPSHYRMAPDGREADGDGRSIASGRRLEMAREHDGRVKAIKRTRFHQSRPSYQAHIVFPGCVGVASRLLHRDRLGKDEVPTWPEPARAEGQGDKERTSHE